MLQAEGRNFTMEMCQVISFILNMFVFDPLLMIHFKLGMFGSGLSTALAEALPAIVLFAFFPMDKFKYHASFKMLFQFSSETKPALTARFARVVSKLTFNVPSFASRYYIAVSTHELEDSLTATQCVVSRVWYIPSSYGVAVTEILLPAASFSIGRVKSTETRIPTVWGKRLLALVGWSFVLWSAKFMAKGLIQNEKYFSNAKDVYFLTFSMCTKDAAQNVMITNEQSWEIYIHSIITCSSIRWNLILNSIKER